MKNKIASLAPIVTALTLSVSGGWLFKLIGLPLPWMLGPLFCVGLAGVSGVKTGEIRGGRQAGQLIIGCALGLYFTPAISLYILNFGIYILAASFAAILIGALAGLLQKRISGISYVTAFFASVPGGASEMAIMAERAGARFDQVALSHSIRILITVSTIPIGVTLAGVSGTSIYTPVNLAVDIPGLTGLIAIAAFAGFIFMKAGIPNAWLLGPLAISILLTMNEHSFSAVPPELSTLAQILMGCSLGSRFKPNLRNESRTLMVGIMASALFTMLLTVSMGLIIAWLIGENGASLILATAPGGLSEMCITAKILKLGVPLITAFQVSRLVIVVLFTLPSWRLLELIQRKR